MTTDPNLPASLAYVLGLVVPFWPLILAAALVFYRRRALSPLLTIWIVLLICWLLAWVFSVPPLFPLIPEPLSSVLFFLTGAVLIALSFFRRMPRLTSIRRHSG